MKRLSIIFIALFFSSCISATTYNGAKGLQFHQEQKSKKAVKKLEAAGKGGYKASGFHYALGETYLELGRYGDAVKELSIAADETATVWFKLGNAYYNSDDFPKAAESYRKALALKPDYLEAIEALAMMYPDGVTKEEALALWEKALELEKRDEWITRAKHYIEQLEGGQ